MKRKGKQRRYPYIVQFCVDEVTERGLKAEAKRQGVSVSAMLRKWTQDRLVIESACNSLRMWGLDPEKVLAQASEAIASVEAA